MLGCYTTTSAHFMRCTDQPNTMYTACSMIKNFMHRHRGPIPSTPSVRATPECVWDSSACMDSFQSAAHAVRGAVTYRDAIAKVLCSNSPR
jgi:hypothetical protein